MNQKSRAIPLILPKGLDLSGVGWEFGRNVAGKNDEDVMMMDGDKNTRTTHVVYWERC